MSREDAFNQIGRDAVKQNIYGTMSFLLGYPPFNQMETHHLAWMVEHCLLRFFGAGDSIIRPTAGPGQHFHIVKQGRVRGERLLAGQSAPETSFEISVGECFPLDRKSTRLNSSHVRISYAVFCLKKKKKKIPTR